MADSPEVFTSADPTAVQAAPTATTPQPAGETFTSADPAAALTPSSTPIEPSPGVGQNILDYVSGRTLGEPILHMITGAAGGIAGDLAGLESAASNRMAASDGLTGVAGKLGQSVISYITGTSDNNPDTIKATVSNALTYDPRSAGGKAVESGIDTVLSPVGTAINYGEGKLGDAASGVAGFLGAGPEAQSDIKSGAQDAGDLALNLIPGEKLIGPAAEGLSDAAKTFANNRAAAALGASKSVVKKLTDSGTDMSPIQDMGRYALDNGILSLTGSPDTMIGRNDALMDAAGKKIGNISDTVSNPDNFAPQKIGQSDLPSAMDTKGVELGGDESSPDMFNMRSVPTISAPELSQTIKDAFKAQLSGERYATPAIQNAIKNITDHLDAVEPTDPNHIVMQGDTSSLGNVPVANGGEPFTANDLAQFKKDINAGLNWSADTPGAKTMQSIWKTVDAKMQDKISEADASNKTANIIDSLGNTNGPIGQAGTLPTNLTEQWKNAKTQYANAKSTEAALANKASTEAGRKVASFTNLISGLAGGIAGGAHAGVEGGILGSMLGPAIHETIHRGMNPALALGADAVSKGANAVSEMSPTQMRTAQIAGTGAADTEQRDDFNGQLPILKQLLQQNPKAFGQYTVPLQAAASRGDDKLAATMYMLGTSDPNYRAVVNSALDDYNSRQ